MLRSVLWFTAGWQSHIIVQKILVGHPPGLWETATLFGATVVLFLLDTKTKKETE